MSQVLKPVERVENIITNMINGGIEKPEIMFRFDRVDENKTIFRTKFDMECDREIKRAIDIMVEMVPNVTIRPLSIREMEFRVY